MQVNGAEGSDQAPQSVAVVRPSLVTEPDERLIVQSPTPPMPVAEAGPSWTQGGAVPVMPVLHLHRHEYVEGVVDQEARVVVDRLATQHGELFSFLHQEVEELKKGMVPKQFAEEVVSWAGRVQGEVERQGREWVSLKRELQVVKAELTAEVGKCKRELNTDLTRLRALIPEMQKPLQEALRKLSSQLTGMSEDWGKDITRILALSQQSTESIDARIAKIVGQNDREHTVLRDKLEDMTARQAVLMTSMEAMETQMHELMDAEKESVSEHLSPIDRLPHDLYEAPVDELSPRPVVRDSVTSPPGQTTRKGSVSPSYPEKPPIKMRS